MYVHTHGILRLAGVMPLSVPGRVALSTQSPHVTLCTVQCAYSTELHMYCNYVLTLVRRGFPFNIGLIIGLADVAGLASTMLMGAVHIYKAGHDLCDICM